MNSTADAIEDFRNQLQESLLSLLQSSPNIQPSDEGFKMMADAALRVWNDVAPDDPRRQLKFDIMPMSEEDKRERRCPKILVSGPREIMEQMFDNFSYEPISPKINISVIVEK
jgi:hypothetical protein